MAAAIRGRRVFAAEALAIGSAASIAASAMLVDSLRGRVGLVRLTRWQLTAAFAMSASLSLAIGGWRTLAPWSLGLLLASGFFGIAVASTTYYAAIFAIGPRLTALLFSLASPFALALGYVFLGETISSTQGAGVALVLAGVALAVGGGRGAALASAGRARLWGIGLGVVTALGQALGGLLARPAMQAGVEPITAMAVRSGLAALLVLLVAATPFVRAAPDAARARDYGVAVAAAFFGTVLGMSLLMAALASGPVGLVTTLSSTTPVLILPMVWAATGERPRLIAWAGAALAVAGAGAIAMG